MPLNVRVIMEREVATVFTCAGCGSAFSLPSCWQCGQEVEQVNGVYQLTSDPNAIISECQVSYIGYDQIGVYYGGRDWIACDPISMVYGEKIAQLTGVGILLDIACGNGYLSVPAALHGCQVISGDISNIMVELLLQKAEWNQVDFNKITPCRMNALSIPLLDNTVDTVTANGVLHLISRPDVVIDEIYRLLKPGGRFILLSNSPALSDEDSIRLRERNKKANQVADEFYRLYWQRLGESGLKPVKYSWTFDQFAAAKKRFGNEIEIVVDVYEECTYKLADWFLYRMEGKGFSDQQHVDDDLHAQVYQEIKEAIQARYGEDFGEIASTGVTDGVRLRVYEKRP